MATKRELIYWVKEKIDSTRESVELHPDHVMYALNSAWNQILYSTFRKNIGMLDFYAKDYVSQTAVANADTGKYEITLPENIVQLPHITAGVRNVTVDEWEDVEFVPQSEEENMLMYDSDTYNVDDVITYHVRADKIIFGQESGDVSGYDFRLSLVIPFKDYADSDEVPIPSGQDVELINIAVQILTQPEIKVIENK